MTAMISLHLTEPGFFKTSLENALREDVTKPEKLTNN